jgi:TonB-dependent receptor
MVPVVNSYWGDTNRRYMPMTTALRDNTYYRVRDGISLAGQWQNHDHTMVATLQYNQSKKREQWEEYVATSSTGVDAWAQPINYVYTSNNVQCLGGVSNCTFDDNGFIQSGTLVNGNGVWYGDWTAPTGANSPNGLMRADYDWSGNGVQRAGGYANDTRWSDSLNDTKDISFNFKWDVTDRLKTNFDIQYVDAVQTNYDISTELATYANVGLNFTGDTPTFTIDNDNTTGWYLAPGGIANPANYRQHFIMDHVTDSDGHEFATRADLAYSFDSPWLNTLKAGVRYADREQTVRWTTYNWANVVNNWSNYDANNYYITGSAFPDQNAYGIHTFDSHFFGGDVTNITDGVFFNINNLKDRAGFANTFDAAHYQPQYVGGGNSNTWTPICHRAGEDSRCFLPAEIADVSEKTKAAYIQLKFGGPEATIFNGVTVVGNIGVRYVETVNESTGGVNYHNTTTYDADPITAGTGGAPDHPSITYYVPGVIGTPPAVTADPITDPDGYAAEVAARNAYVNNPANWTEDRAFAATVSTALQTASVTHKNWLPSFNVRFGLTDQWFLRFAASKAMSRPDIGNLKAYTSVSMSLPNTASSTYDCDPSTGAFNCDSSGNIVSTRIKYTANANNPYLKPITADQFDLSIENYFSQTGSFTFTGFYKQFHDYITYGKYVKEFTNAGITRPVEVSGPVNAAGGAIKGFEIAYQTFFDSLPSPWNGLGIQANFTKLKNDGIESTGVVVNSGDGSSGQSGGGTSVAALGFTKLPLEGLSDTTYNLVGMFEKGKWSARMAYNWRSKYLVTRQDCCVAFPIWQRAAGYLDGRVAYRINDNVEVSLEGTNLLDTETVLMQQVDGPMSDGTDRPLLLLPNAWFKNDRRIQAQIRLKY